MTGAQTCLQLATLLFVSACAAGPTLYLGAAPALDAAAPVLDAAAPVLDAAAPVLDAGALDAGADAAEPVRDDGGRGAEEEEDDDDDDLPCSADSDCAGSFEGRTHCDVGRARCVSCLDDRHCAQDERCDIEEGDCDDDL